MREMFAFEKRSNIKVFNYNWSKVKLATLAHLSLSKHQHVDSVLHVFFKVPLDFHYGINNKSCCFYITQHKRTKKKT